MFSNSKNFRVKPGWSDYVSDIYKHTRELRRMWLERGASRQGPLFNELKISKARFKYAKRFIERNEDLLRKESIAKKHAEANSKQFWTEINSINNSKMPLPTTIDGSHTPNDILQLWKDHFKNIYNCIPKRNCANSLKLDSEIHEVKVNCTEISDAIKSLDSNKSCGLEGIYAEHMKFASKRFIYLLSLCFTGLFVHGILPDSLMSVILVPIVKNKCGNINSKDNYMQIALASIVSKLI